MSRFFLIALCAFVCTPLALAQSAQEILGDALSRYESNMAGVENYTLTQTVMGTETVTYAEREPDGAPLAYAMYLVTPGGLQAIGGSGGTLDTPYTLIDRIRASARYVGTEEIGGKQSHAIAVDNFGEIVRDFEAMPEQAEAEMNIETATFYIDADEGLMRGMTMTGTITNDGRTSPVTMETRFLDFRTVDGFTTPFRTTMEVQGMDGQMDPGEREEARRQLEEARRQMESMPAAQREMMARMMGDRLEQLEEMLAGDGLSFEIAVTDVKVNTGRPN